MTRNIETSQEGNIESDDYILQFKATMLLELFQSGFFPLKAARAKTGKDGDLLNSWILCFSCITM